MEMLEHMERNLKEKGFIEENFEEKFIKPLVDKALYEKSAGNW